MVNQNYTKKENPQITSPTYNSRYIEPRPTKETRECGNCGVHKKNSLFFEWYTHPALTSFQESKLIAILCMKCAQREYGSKGWKKYKERKGF